MGFPLTDQQKHGVENRGGGLLVSAAAGSGKTRVLVERLLYRVEEEGVNIDQFLVITYTKAAAAELRGRIVKELSARLTLDPTNRHLRRQMTLIYKTQISTIHAFCTQILREHGHVIDLSPDARLLDESESAVLMEEAMAEVLEERYQTIQPDDDFAQLLDMLSGGRDDRRLVEIVLDIYAKVQSHPNAIAWMEYQRDLFSLEGVTDVAETPWGGLILERARGQVEYWRGRIEEAVILASSDEKLEKSYVPSLKETAKWLQDFAQALNLSWDAAAAASTPNFPKLGAVRNCEDPVTQGQVKAIREQCKKRMTKLAVEFLETNEMLIQGMQEIYPAVRGLFSLVLDFSETYERWKTRRNVLDFSDLEHKSVQLLVSGEGTPTLLAQQIGQRYLEIMVDEYQDTNVVQNAIFTALSQGEKNLFMVGDVKQSIYRFRLADPTIFLEKYRNFAPHEKAQEGQPRRILLSQNFRSHPSVLDGANFLFRNIMSRTFGEMDYTAEEALYPGASFGGNPEDYAVELDVLDLKESEEEGEAGEKPQRNLLEARFVAKRIRELLDEEFPIQGDGGVMRPIEPGDVAILLRSPGTMLPYYVQALGEQGLPWEADGGGDFLESTEVAVILAYLKIIDNPAQDIPLISVLRSPLWGFSPDRLAQIRAGCKGCDFYSALCQDEKEDSRAFLASLDGLRERAPELSCHQLLWEVYDAFHVFPLFAALGEGELRRGHLLAFSECAKGFEQAGHKGLFGFLHYLERVRASGGKFSMAQPREQGNGVRILSIHKSKGLEFPVVFIGGLMRRLNRQDMQKPVLFHQRLGIGPKGLDTQRQIAYPTLARRAVAMQLESEMMAEELRLLYVAVTRAQKKLILVCALTGGAGDLDRLAESATCPVEPQALLGTQSVGQWVLMACLPRPDASALRQKMDAPVMTTVAECGAPWDVRWQDGRAFRDGLVQERTEETEAVEAVPDADLAARLTWQYPYASDSDIPSKLTATQLKGRAVDEEVGEDTIQLPQNVVFERPHFAQDALGLTPAQRGTALHLVMQFISFDGMDEVERVKEEIQRLVEIETIEPRQGAAVQPEKIAAFFRSPLGKTMMASDSLHREFKFSILVPACDYNPQAGEGQKVLLQGVVDCWFETQEGITIVDFKTDRVGVETMAQRAKEHKPQLDSYAHALSEVTGKPVAHKVLWFFSQNTAIEI